MTGSLQPAFSVPTSEELLSILAVSRSAQAAAALVAVVEHEDRLAADNLLAPYADRLPPVLTTATADRVADALSGLSGPLMQRILFGNFRRVPGSVLQAITDRLPEEALADLLTALSWGYDGPRLAAALIAGAAAPPVAALRRLEPVVAARLLGLLHRDLASAVLQRVRSEAARRWWAAVREAAVPAELVVLEADPAGAEPPDGGARPDPRDMAVGLLAGWRTTEPDPSVLERGNRSWQRDLLSALPARAAGELLGELARGQVELAALLLGALAEFVLVPEGGAARRVPRALRATRVLAAVPPGAFRPLTDALDPRVADLVLPPVREGRYLGSSYPPTRARGRRRRRSQLTAGVDWVHVEEMVESDGRSQPFRVDLLELDLTRLHVRARCAPGERIPLPEVRAMVGDARRDGARPPESLFRSLGLVRLSEQVRAQGAVAGLNGGFYFDYGHYLDALDLGIDLSQEVGLAFGDVIDWFVQDGVELSPPLFGRAALAVTEDGAAYLRRVRMTAVEVQGRRLGWDCVNRETSATVRYDRVFGPQTPLAPGKVDLVIAGGTLMEVRNGGGSRIPLLGCVLSVPTGRFRGAALLPGAPVKVHSDFPPELGRVEQAMACGPLLVRDGQVDLEVAAESFGEKDSSVLPLSLTRASDSFRAARSFLMTRGATLCFGAVSGTMLGGGIPPVSRGATFGELAQLCVDLGADEAMALDGGGSSTLVAATPDPQVLNVPTGGSDVPVGSERFVKTYLLATARNQ